MDINHLWGGDLAVGSSTDLDTVDGTQRNQQRILRRLLTNPASVNPDGTVNAGDYAAHPDYGAGVASYIGANAEVAQIKALIRGQMLMESCVARSPEPQIDVQFIDVGIACSISYVDATANTPQTLTFNVNV